MTDYDLGKKETRKHAIGTVGGGIIGGVLGGYPGMMIGMSLGGWLFKPDPPRDKDYYNEEYKVYKSKVDPVPDVIGTDMAAGKCIWINKNTLGIYHTSMLPSMGESVNAAAWEEFIDMMSHAKVAQWAEFAVDFGGRYLPNSINHIGVIKINTKPCWFWIMLSDMFENYDDPLAPYNPLTHLDGGQDYWFAEVQIDQVINQPVKFNTVMYFKGLLADFTLLNTDPSTSNFMIDVNNLADMNPGQFQINKLSTFPIFTTEINRGNVWYSPESMQGGTGLPGYSWWYEDEDDQVGYYIQGNAWYGTRDARNKMFYGRDYFGDPVYCDPVERVIKFAGNDAISNNENDIMDWFDANILKWGSVLQATDVHTNRAYMCIWRNWWEPYQQAGVYGMDRVNHHHAEYGIRFDIYYHDLDDPEYKVHSFLYDEEFSIFEKEGSCPRLYFGGMVVSENHIYIMGAKRQTDVMLDDYRTILSGSTYSRIYADFSQYADGYWEGCYASLQQNGYDLYREITVQTSTYIDVDGEFAAFPTSGKVVEVSKYPKQVTDFAIAGEGSTASRIICNPPDPSPWSYGGGKAWEYVHFINDWLYKVGIDYIDGTEVYLTSSLSRAPNPGERICFGFDRTGSDYDTDITNPTLDEDPYDYYDTFIDDLGFSESDPQWVFRPGNLIDTDHASHHICLKIDKTTGEVELVDFERTLVGQAYFTVRFWTAGMNVYACSTDKQAFVYSHGAGYPTAKQALTYVIDFDSETIIDKVNRRNQYASGHAPQWCYMGTTSVKEWDADTEEYIDVWYSLLRNFDSYEGLNDSIDQGQYFLKLTEGKFSNHQVVAKNVPSVEYGLDINRNGIIPLLYRRIVATGPMYMAMDLGSFASENSYKIGKYGIRDHIYFYIQRTNANSAGRHEMWKYIPPTESNPAGELYMISKGQIEVDDVKYQWNRIAWTGTFTHSKYGFYGNGSGLWYMCDEVPSEVIEDFWRYYTDPRYFHTDIEYQLDVSEANSICKGVVDTKLYTPFETMDIKERRFQFSQYYDSPKQMHDVINEILATCQGFISPCLWDNNGIYSKLYKLMIPNPDETPVFYFGKEETLFTSNQVSDDKSKIYADFSAYPDNYWKGDEVDYGEVMDHSGSIPDNQFNWIIEQTSTYIDMAYALNDYWPNSKQFTLTKDNIKEGSFTFAEKSYLERPNKVRIEFKNRLLDYAKDVAEAEDAYRLDILNEVEKIDFYKMHGIKRATQAGRMAQRILDQWNYQKFTCAFETDIMGMTLCMGDIIGVSHDTTGWYGKWFRIVAMEELMDFEIKFELEEFNPYCYHDSGIPVLNGFGFGGFPQPYTPTNVERFEVKEDIETGELYFTFKEPSNDGGFFVGAKIYVKVGSEYELISLINETVSSVKLAQDVGTDDTIIYYDPDTMSGSFPSEGIIWIENELMYYHGIDTTNNAFTNVVRGWLDTDIVEHLVEDELYIKLRSDATLGYEVPDDWVGTTQTFKAAAFTIHGFQIGVEISPSADIDIVGYGILPYFPESIHIPISELPELEYLFESFGLSGIIDETERVIEALGLSDTAVGESIVHLIEALGLNDSVIVVESLAQLVEDLGFDDSALVSETLTALAETLGLDDDLAVAEMWEYITEGLGINDSATVSETLAIIAEILGLGDVVSEELIGGEEEYELKGFGLEGGGLLLTESSEALSLEETDNDEESMIILNNNMF